MAATAAQMVVLIDEAIEALVRGGGAARIKVGQQEVEYTSVEELRRLREMYVAQSGAESGRSRRKVIRIAY